MPTRPISRLDLDHTLIHTRTLWPDLANHRLFLTGGTGFFGHWLLESLLHASRELSLNLRVTVLTRNPTAFAQHSPHLANDPAITLLEGDIRSFPFPSKHHEYILHAATDSGSQQATQPPFALAESILDGTRRTLGFARETSARRLLFISTGAVYGRSSTLPHIPETCLSAPDPLALTSAYDEAKRMAEHLCIAHAHEAGFDPVIARPFAFVGPHLPLDAHFAIGNFLAAALANRPLHIRSDGIPLRSWLYTADLTIWLWTLLLRAPANRAYNIGSEAAYTIADAARLTADTLNPTLPIRIDGTPVPGAPVNSYVPSTERARDDLGLIERIPLPEALRRTAAWHGFVV